ncbi:MAG: hypothetical protein FWE05_04345, partial [Defluviitaleaceae bacterium]|nr:hypothetical protein [Defluviitaleaceae bacterium]
MEKLIEYRDGYVREYSVGEKEKYPKGVHLRGEEKHYSTKGIVPVRIGSGYGDHIQLQDTKAVFTLYEDYLHAIDATDLYLNGNKINTGQHSITYGDSIWASTTHFVVHEGYITCFGTGYLSNLNISPFTPKPYDEFPIYKRSPRIIKREPTDTIDIVAPEKKEAFKKGGLVKVILPPLAMVMVTVAMGVLLGRGLFVLMSASAMTVSIIFSITNFFGDIKKRKEKEHERQESYDKYLLRQRKKIHGMQMEFVEALRYHNLSPKEIGQ